MHEQNRPNPPALDPPANAHNAATAPTTAHSAAGVPHNAGTSENIKKEVNDHDGDFCEEITYAPRETLINNHGLPTLIHTNRDRDNLEFNTLKPAFSQLDLVERIKAIGFSHQVAMDGDGQLCVVAISSDAVPTALLYR